MIPPGKTTLTRMQLAAHDEATRIEISHDGRIRSGMMSEPIPELIARRDDFAGIVRMIDAIMSHQVLQDLLRDRMRAIAAAGITAPAGDATTDMEIEGE